MAKRTVINLDTVVFAAIDGEVSALSKIREHYQAVIKATGKDKTPEIIKAVKPVIVKHPTWPQGEGKPLGEKQARGTVAGDFWNRFTAYLREQDSKAAGKGSRVSGDWIERMVKALAKVSVTENVDYEELTILELVEHLGKADLFKKAFAKYEEAEA
jgi:hypothetical protein